MADKKRISMEKPNGGRQTATANVLPEDVETWETAGWKRSEAPAEKPKAPAKG